MLDFACIVSATSLFLGNDSEKTGSVAWQIWWRCCTSEEQEALDQLEEASSIFGRYREGKTPVGIGTAVGTEDEEIILSDLDHFLDLNINMRSVVIIGNRTSKAIDGWFVTPRGYRV
jgi:precorrin-3B methylase